MKEDDAKRIVWACIDALAAKSGEYVAKLRGIEKTKAYALQFRMISYFNWDQGSDTLEQSVVAETDMTTLDGFEAIARVAELEEAKKALQREIARLRDQLEALEGDEE